MATVAGQRLGARDLESPNRPSLQKDIISCVKSCRLGQLNKIRTELSNGFSNMEFSGDLDTEF